MGVGFFAVRLQRLSIPTEKSSVAQRNLTLFLLPAKSLAFWAAKVSVSDAMEPLPPTHTLVSGVGYMPRNGNAWYHAFRGENMRMATTASSAADIEPAGGLPTLDGLLEQYAASAKLRELVAHNVQVLRCVRGGLNMASAHRLTFDPRAEYWRRPERRFVLAYFAEWTGYFRPADAHCTCCSAGRLRDA